MGKQKYQKEIEKLFKKSNIVSYSSIERFVKSKKNANQYTKQLVRNLIKQGKVKRITKGFYTLHEDPSLTVFCFKPAYLGLQDALSLHNLWEQETIPVIISANKARQGIRNVLGTNILLRRIEKKYMFGFDYYTQGNFYLPYSDIEKTFIDMVYFNQPLSKELLINIRKKISIKKLDSYLKNYPKQFRKIVVGYLKTNGK